MGEHRLRPPSAETRSPLAKRPVSTEGRDIFASATTTENKSLLISIPPLWLEGSLADGR